MYKFVVHSEPNLNSNNKNCAFLWQLSLQLHPAGFVKVKSLLRKNFVRLRPKPGNVGRPARYSKLSFVYCRYWGGKFKTCVCKRHCIRATSYKGLLMQYLCDCSSLYDPCSVICKELIQSTSGYKYKQRYTDICPCTA